MTNPDVRRVVLLLAAFPEATARQVSGELVGRTAPLRQRASDAGVRLVTGTRIPDDPLAAAGEATGRSISPVAAIVEITGARDTPDDDLLRPLEGFGHWFGGVFDKTATVAALGPVRTITAGPEGPHLLALGTRKRRGISTEDFHDHWLGTHAPLALSLMPERSKSRFRYEQLHAEETASARAADVAGVGVGDYAGILLVRCGVPADFLEVAAEPSFAAKIREDELQFADPDGMRGGFLEIR